MAVSPLADGWGELPHRFRICGPCGALSGFARTAGVRYGGSRSPLVRSPARLPRWPGAGRWRVRAFPLVRNSGLGSVFSLLPPAERRFRAPGTSARCGSLLSGNRFELRKPAQHKSGSPSRKDGDPAERASSRNRPRRPGGACERSNFLQHWRVRHAPARPNGPGAGKVLRKVPM